VFSTNLQNQFDFEDLPTSLTSDDNRHRSKQAALKYKKYKEPCWTEHDPGNRSGWMPSKLVPFNKGA